MSTVQKSRVWAFTMYPDSAPENWRSLLANFCIDILVSPVHDRDCWTEEDEKEDPSHIAGEVKKPHRHVMLMWDGPVTEQAAQHLADALSATKVIRIRSKRSYARYLCHLDNDDKAHYEVSDVLSFGSIDYFDLIASASDIDQTISEMEQWVDENQCYSYASLCRYARANRPDWTRLLRHSCTVHMRAYMQSCFWESQQNFVKPEVGENL